MTSLIASDQPMEARGKNKIPIGSNRWRNGVPVVLYAFDHSIFPILEELAGELAVASGYKGQSQKFSEIAFYHENIIGRHALISHCSRWLQSHQQSLKTHYQQIFEASASYVIDLGFCGGIEQAFLQNKVPYSLLSDDVDLSFTKPGTSWLFGLGGNINQPSSVILTETDLFDWEHRHTALKRDLYIRLALNPLIWLGGDLEDSLFRQWRQLLLGGLRRDYQQEFVLFPKKIKPSLKQLWMNEGATIVEGDDLTGLLNDTLSNLPKSGMKSHVVRSLQKPSIELQARPYKFLDYYTNTDAHLFFGRDEKIDTAIASILHSHLLLLYGSSGVGKTSLMRAGLQSQLEERGLMVFYLRAEDDLAFCVEVAQKDAPKESSYVFILDQAEEMYTAIPDPLRIEKMRELSELFHRGGSNTKWILVFQENFLPEFFEWTQNLTDVRYEHIHLPPFTKPEARLAIEKPALEVNCGFEDGLVNRIIDDLFIDGIFPVELQIVCDRLFDQRDSNGIMRLHHYSDLGGARQILADYLDVSLQYLEEKERKEAIKTLNVMVSSSGTKLPLQISEISQRTGMSKQSVEKFVQKLILVRLIRSIERGGQKYYELTHDLLGERIRVWENEKLQQAHEITHLLEGERSAGRQIQLVLDRDKIKKIHAERDNPHLSLNKEDLGLILDSVLDAGIDPAYWIKRSLHNGVEVWPILETKLQSPRDKDRRNAAFGLSSLPGPRAIDALVALLHDSSPNVRVASHQALVAMDRPEALQALETEGEMRVVPAGTFWMGRPEGFFYVIKHHVLEVGLRHPGLWWFSQVDIPMHQIFLQSFLADRFPVTCSQYKDFMEEGGYTRPEFWTQAGWQWRIRSGREHPSLWKDSKWNLSEYPIVGVSWYEAKAYARWAGKRLLTEAEWEKAARGTAGWLFPWGKFFDAKRCNTLEGAAGGLTKVGQYSPMGDSPFGLADMAGNVWEWTHSLYRSYPYDASDGREDEATEGLRIPRGGSWSWYAQNARSCARGNNAPDYFSNNLGFRCATDIGAEDD